MRRVDALRVLHLPVNYASQMDVLVGAMRARGVDARGIVAGSSTMNSSTHIRNYNLGQSRRGGVAGRRIRAFAYWAAVLRAIAGADVVHWHSTPALPRALDLRWARFLGRRMVVEFHGTDIRTVTSDDVYLWRVTNDPQADYQANNTRSYRTQSVFAREGCACVCASPEMTRYLIPNAFRDRLTSFVAVDLDSIGPMVPPQNMERPVLVHAASNPAGKGTAYVLAAVDELRAQFDFDFVLLEKASRDEVLAAVSSCDIYLDQFIVGSYGLAAVEAMALGKPVVAYLAPSIRSVFPDSLPVASARPEYLATVLAGLLAEPDRRRALGVAGRKYVESFHEAGAVADQMLDWYSKLG